MMLDLLYGMIGLLAFGLAVLTALRLIVPEESQRRGNLLHWTIALAARIFVFVGLFGPLLIVLAYVGLFIWAAVLVVCVAAFERAYRARQYALLGLLAVSAERFLPLAPAMDAFAEEQGGRLGRRLRELVKRLAQGWPLHAALWTSKGVIPPEALPVVRVGYESGRLAPALRRAVATHSAEQPAWDAVSGKLVYLWMLLCIAASVVTFMMLKIVPAMQRIFDDFEAELPPLTQLLILVFDHLGPLALLAAAGFLAVLGYVLLCYCGARLPWLPGANWLVRRRDSATVLEALALAAGAGRPLIHAVATLADSFPAWDVRLRLRMVLADMAAGRDWLDSLRARRLAGRAEAGVLRAAERVGNLPWAMNEVAQSCRRRSAYRVQLLLQVLFPVVILAIGLAVMVLVVGYFMPLIAIIQRLT